VFACVDIRAMLNKQPNQIWLVGSHGGSRKITPVRVGFKNTRIMGHNALDSISHSKQKC
jgi:hypothetical protein